MTQILEISTEDSCDDQMENQIVQMDLKPMRMQSSPDRYMRKEMSRADNPTTRPVEGKPAALTPGPHTTDQDEYVEIGNDDFTDTIIGRLPEHSVYRRGGVAGEIVGEIGKRAFSPLSNDGTRIIIDRYIRLRKWATKGKGDESRQVSVYLSTGRDHAGLVLSAAAIDPRLPEVKQLTSYPVYINNFSLAKPGFHNGVYFDEPPDIAGLEPELNAEVIRQVLDDWVVDFPFKDEASRQNYFGLAITPLIRPAIAGNVPMHLILATLERTGKTKLAEEGIGGVIQGRKTPAQQLGKNDEEIDKRIIAMLLRGENLMHLDNLGEFLDSPSLASLSTASTYMGRLLGSSKMVELPNTVTTIATGNNVRASGELVKRTVPILLQPATDSPELRTDFVHPDFYKHTIDNRRLILSCLLGAVEIWKLQGQPRGQTPMGGFDQWAAVVGGILATVGYTEWLSNAKEWRRESDPRGSDLRSLVTEWQATYQRRSATVNELLAIAMRLEIFPDVLGGKTDKALQTSFGMRVLARNVNTPVGKWVIRRNSLARPALYFLENGGEA